MNAQNAAIAGHSTASSSTGKAKASSSAQNAASSTPKSYAKACRDCGQLITMKEQADGRWKAFGADGLEHRCTQQEKKAESYLPPATEGRIRQIAREVAEQVVKEKLEGIVD